MAFRYFNFSLDFAGDSDVIAPEILAYSAGSDRYTKKKGLSEVVVVQLAGVQLLSLPPTWDGFIVQRSPDMLAWADISGVVRDSYLFVDTPPGPGIWYYRARARKVTGPESSHGNELSVTVEEWGHCDDLGSHCIQAVDGLPLDRLDHASPFPDGLSGLFHDGMSLSEGSIVGGFADGVWGVESQEYDPPIRLNEVPACGALGVTLPLTNITYSLQDQAYPVGGSGIADATLKVWLSVASESGGAFKLIRDGATEPFSPTITCAVVTGVDVAKDRDLSITVPAGYIKSGDVVIVRTYVEDFDGNAFQGDCQFTMELVDTIPPVVSNQVPECGTGLTGEPKVTRNFSFAFKVSDFDSGVDLATLQVFHGPSETGPWTQILMNGATFLGGFTGAVVFDGGDGYDVTINRPVASPLWDANAKVCFRIDADDNAGNSVQNICCVMTEDCTRIRQVVPIAENLLYVEFTNAVFDGDVLRNPRNFIITPVETDTSEVLAKRVLTQGFTPPADFGNPATRLGLGNPRFVFLDTGMMEPWAEYDLTTQNILDQYGLPFCDPLPAVRFRAKITKVDEGRDAMKDVGLLQKDSLSRRLLVGLLTQDEQIGGVDIPDDWETQ